MKTISREILIGSLLKQPNELWFVCNNFPLTFAFMAWASRTLSKRSEKWKLLSGIWIQFIHVLAAPSFLECISNGVYKRNRMSNQPAREGKYKRKKKKWKNATQTATQWIQNEGMRKIENCMLAGLWNMGICILCIVYVA